MKLSRWLRWLTKEPEKLITAHEHNDISSDGAKKQKRIRSKRNIGNFRGARPVNVDAIVRQIKTARLKLAATLIQRHKSYVVVGNCNATLNLPSAVIPKDDEEFEQLIAAMILLGRYTAIARALLGTYKRSTIEYRKLERVLG